MNILSNLQKHLFQTLNKKVDARVYNHVPDNAPFPYIRIGHYNSIQITNMPPGFEVNASVEIYTNTTSSLPCADLVGQVTHLLNQVEGSTGQFVIVSCHCSSSSVQQLRNNIWCGKIALKIITTYKQ